MWYFIYWLFKADSLDGVQWCWLLDIKSILWNGENYVLVIRWILNIMINTFRQLDVSFCVHFHAEEDGQKTLVQIEHTGSNHML